MVSRAGFTLAAAFSVIVAAIDLGVVALVRRRAGPRLRAPFLVEMYIVNTRLIVARGGGYRGACRASEGSRCQPGHSQWHGRSVGAPLDERLHAGPRLWNPGSWPASSASIRMRSRARSRISSGADHRRPGAQPAGHSDARSHPGAPRRRPADRPAAPRPAAAPSSCIPGRPRHGAPRGRRRRGG